MTGGPITVAPTCTEMLGKGVAAVENYGSKGSELLSKPITRNQAKSL